MTSLRTHEFISKSNGYVWKITIPTASIDVDQTFNYTSKYGQKWKLNVKLTRQSTYGTSSATILVVVSSLVDKTLNKFADSVSTKVKCSTVDRAWKSLRVTDETWIDFQKPSGIEKIFGKYKSIYQISTPSATSLPVLCDVDVDVTWDPKHMVSQTGRKCGETKAAIFENFSTLLDSVKLSDVVLKVDDCEMKAHKCILSASSPVFDKMFEQPMKETSTNQVDITDFSSNTIEKMLKFMYSLVQPDLLNYEEAEELYKAAHKYQIAGLVRLCRDYICTEINHDNVMAAFCLAVSYTDDELRYSACTFISQNPKSNIKFD